VGVSCGRLGQGLLNGGESERMANIGLVLGGGGARCFSQVGVLRAFEEAQVRPEAIAACSTAAIIGALYAAGYDTNRIYEVANATNFRKLLTFSSGSGLISHRGVAELLAEHLPETFEELKVPLAVVAVDIRSWCCVRGCLFRRYVPATPSLASSVLFITRDAIWWTAGS
jgi:predicted acylesterase/phospholipase RssA